MKRDRRFPIVLSQAERVALQQLAEHERLPAAAVVRRLIWAEAKRHGLLPPAHRNNTRPQPTQEAYPEHR